MFIPARTLLHLTSPFVELTQRVAAIYQIVSSKSLAEEGADVGKKFDPREGNNITLSQEGRKEESKTCC
jgi:Ras-related protein Rab-11A